MKTVLGRKILPYVVVLLGVLYGIWPVDLIPDFPVFGLIDDVGIIGSAIFFAVKLYAQNKKRS